MKTKKIIPKLIETTKEIVNVLSGMAERLHRIEKALELDYICGRWVMPHEGLSLTIRKSPSGYRIVLLGRGRVIRCYDASADNRGNVTYGVPDGPPIGKVWYERGDPYIILEHLGVFYLHQADTDTAVYS